MGSDPLTRKREAVAAMASRYDWTLVKVRDGNLPQPIHETIADRILGAAEIPALLAELAAAKASAQAISEAAQAEATTFRKNIAALVAEVSALRTRLAEESEEREALRVEAAGLYDRLGAAENALTDACEERDMARAELVIANERGDGWRKEFDRDTDKIAALRSEVEVRDRRINELTDALAHIVEVADDYGTCPYFTKHDEGGDPEGTCGFGCSDEPACHTCRPRGGWASERARGVLAAGGDTERDAK